MDIDLRNTTARRGRVQPARSEAERRLRNEVFAMIVLDRVPSPAPQIVRAVFGGQIATVRLDDIRELIGPRMTYPNASLGGEA
jgi:hypothetical protein